MGSRRDDVRQVPGSAAEREPTELLRYLFGLIACLGILTIVVSLVPEGALHDAGVITMLILSIAVVPVIFGP